MGVQINQLSTTTPGAGQSVPVYDPSKGDARRWSLSDLLAWMQANLVFPATGMAEPETLYRSPNDGDTIAFDDTDDDQHMIVTPLLGLAAVTITLPAVGTIRDKQTILVNSTQAIAALTLDGNGATVGGGTYGIMGADDFFALKYDIIDNKWYQIG